jgi:hypothetical protein
LLKNLPWTSGKSLQTMGRAQGHEKAGRSNEAAKPLFSSKMWQLIYAISHTFQCRSISILRHLVL